mgnify:CR=1 FL=1
MRSVFGLVLVLGLGLAGFAVYMAQGYFEAQNAALQMERAAAAEAVPTINVVAVNRDITYGERITEDDVVVIKYAEPFLPEGIFRTMEEVFVNGPDDQRIVLRPMQANEPLLAVKVSEPGASGGITSQLERGMRAFAIKVDAQTGVSGFLRPGDRVDVYWSGRGSGIGELDAQGITKLIEPGIRIVAVDQNSDNSRSEALIARTVTVEVTPQQVASLAQAQSTGNLSLSLVGNEDDTVAQVTEVDQRSLLGVVQRQIIPTEVEKVCTIRTRRGAEVVELPIPCSTN